MAITILNNGPILIDNNSIENIEVLDGDGKPFDTKNMPKIALCRCGLSDKKPFCDGKHKVGWTWSTGPFISEVKANG